MPGAGAVPGGRCPAEDALGARLRGLGAGAGRAGMAEGPVLLSDSDSEGGRAPLRRSKRLWARRRRLRRPRPSVSPGPGTAAAAAVASQPRPRKCASPKDGGASDGGREGPGPA